MLRFFWRLKWYIAILLVVTYLYPQQTSICQAWEQFSPTLHIHHYDDIDAMVQENPTNSLYIVYACGEHRPNCTLNTDTLKFNWDYGQPGFGEVFLNDRYIAEAKGSNINNLPKLIDIKSNVHPHEVCY